jgi:hypothetical protein
MSERPRKLAEIWQVGDDYQLRVIVGAFQRQFTGKPDVAEDVASFEAIEVLRKIVADADGGRVRLAADDRLEP